MGVIVLLEVCSFRDSSRESHLCASLHTNPPISVGPPTRAPPMMDWASDNLEDILPLEELGDDMQLQIDMQIHSSAPSGRGQGRRVMRNLELNFIHSNFP